MIGQGLPELTPVEIVGCEVSEAGSPQALDYGQFTFMEQFVKHDDRKDEILKELEEAIKKLKEQDCCGQTQ